MALLVLPAAALFPPSFQDASPSERRARRSLEAALKEVVRVGAPEDDEEILAVLAEIGVPKEELRALETRTQQDRGKGGGGGSLSRAVSALREAAATLAEDLPKLPEEARAARARTILRIDGESRPAHELLGHVQGEERWRSEEQFAVRERAALVQLALQEAALLPFEVATGPAAEPLLAVVAEESHAARFGDLLLEGTRSADELARILRSALRACALSRAVREDVLELPAVLPSAPTHLVLLRNREEYRAVLDAAVERAEIDAEDRAFAERLSGYTLGDRLVLYRVSEAQCVASCTYFLCRRFLGAGLEWEPAPALVVGHVHWLCLALFGVAAPELATLEEESALVGAGAADTRSLPSEDARERMRRLLLSTAGLEGHRGHLQTLVRKHEDPPFASALVAALHEQSGVFRLKSAFMAEWLQQRGLFEAVLEASAVPRLEDVPAALEGKLGPFPEFERRWRDWFLPVGEGLVQRLEERAAVLDEDTRRVLEELGRIRRRAFTHALIPFDLELRPELSEGCRLHSVYLAANRDQLDRWPHMHEESADREGYAVRGAWAGLHSVVAPDVKDGRTALDLWMASFYHRLPLLDPGLLGIGYSRESGIAVLDSGTLVSPTDRELWVLWPASGSREVPRRFAFELPSPIPGQDPSHWGYPITLQTFGDARTWTLELRRGGAEGPVVAAQFLTPTTPRNPWLAPAGAYCLLPEAPLEMAQRYTILATREDGEHFQSSFDTVTADAP